MQGGASLPGLPLPCNLWLYQRLRPFHGGISGRTPCLGEAHRQEEQDHARQRVRIEQGPVDPIAGNLLDKLRRISAPVWLAKEELARFLESAEMLLPAHDQDHNESASQREPERSQATDAGGDSNAVIEAGCANREVS